MRTLGTAGTAETAVNTVTRKINSVSGEIMVSWCRSVIIFVIVVDDLAILIDLD